MFWFNEKETERTLPETVMRIRTLRELWDMLNVST
jgi:hypothetical protein